MATVRHSFTEATINAHRDVVRTITAMPRLAWTVLAIVVLQAVVEFALGRLVPKESLLGRDLAGIVTCILVTPYLIAVHRFVIAGEVTPRYRLDWKDRRYQLFFGWWFVMYVLTRAMAFADLLPKNLALLILAFAMMVAICVLLTRVVILFPAIALDAPGATPRNAFDDTRGHGWYIFFLLIVSFLPSMLAVGLIIGVIAIISRVAALLLIAPLLALAVMLWLTLGVVVVSRLYQNLGDRLNRPA
jgi:hypothetical protein